MFNKKIIDILCLYINGCITYNELLFRLSEAGPESDLLKILPDTPDSFPQINGLKEKVIEILKLKKLPDSEKLHIVGGTFIMKE